MPSVSPECAQRFVLQSKINGLVSCFTEFVIKLNMLNTRVLEKITLTFLSIKGECQYAEGQYFCPALLFTKFLTVH